MNTNKVIYWVATATFCGIMLFSAMMYFTKYEMVKGFFIALGYPIYIIYPLATAKILGIFAVLSKKSQLLKEWAYAGFMFDGILAATAHFYAKDGGHLMALIVIVALIISRIHEPKVTNLYT